ncbi:MAG TPA: hypothetical protein VNS50_07955 [Ginsengibacter sp.]|nr:hypothetical protein [Ginsengibacter sp.]
MTIEGHKNEMLLQLKKAEDCEEAEQIIHEFIQLMQNRHVYPGLIAYYLHKLRDGLAELSPNDFDSVHWCNIRCALINLKKITGKGLL